MPTRTLRYILIWLLYELPSKVAARASGGVTWGKNSLPASLTSGNISFDPLGVAAILHNPRAILSSTRMYVQWEYPIFLWPHTMMMGGVLIPFKRLGDHLLGSAEHPALEMYHQVSKTIPIRTDTVFKVLPLDFGNQWASEAIEEPSSQWNLQFDIVICHVPDEDPCHDIKWASLDKKQKPLKMRLHCLLLHGIIVATGGFIAVGLWFSYFSRDIWSIGLFSAYAMHWLSGLWVSWLRPLRRQTIPVREDYTTRYAVFDRTGDRGMVVFTGTQQALESWGRTSWIFLDGIWRDLAHWSWTLSGSLCALASLACMVNMNSVAQLVYLALLLISSLAEIFATRSATAIRKYIYRSTELVIRRVDNNKTRTEAIIKATLGNSETGNMPEKRLHHVRWLEKGLLPSIPTLVKLQVLLDDLKDLYPDKDQSQIMTLLDKFVKP